MPNLNAPRVLIVDDDSNILSGYQRSLRQTFEIATAQGGNVGLEIIRASAPFAVVVSDMRMPLMDGIEFLTAVKEQAPDTVRIMLTGNADLETAIEVVNKGNIFRFLTKPCPPEVLTTALKDAVRQHQLVLAERELLEKTLHGAIRVLTEILSVVDPRAFDRSQALRDLMVPLAKALKQDNAWELSLAAMLSQIGNVTIPPKVLTKLRSRLSLLASEQELLDRVPRVGRDWLARIPRLEKVAEIV